MYEQPLTAEHIRLVKEILRYEVIGPVVKGLACGDTGKLTRHRSLTALIRDFDQV